MGTDEIQIFEYLNSCPNKYVSMTEIARRVGGKARLQDDPHWVRPVLQRMLADEILEADDYCQYRLKMRATSKEAEKLTMENWETWELVLEEPCEDSRENIGPSAA